MWSHKELLAKRKDEIRDSENVQVKTLKKRPSKDYILEYYETNVPEPKFCLVKTGWNKIKAYASIEDAENASIPLFKHDMIYHGCKMRIINKKTKEVKELLYD